jgi:GxxExxY protein
MEYELINRGLFVEGQVGLPLIYKNIKMEIGYRLDLLIERKVIVEIKSVETLSKLHFKQLVTYLKLSGLRVGILVNFNTAEISSSIHRKVNNFVP